MSQARDHVGRAKRIQTYSISLRSLGNDHARRLSVRIIKNLEKELECLRILYRLCFRGGCAGLLSNAVAYEQKANEKSSRGYAGNFKKGLQR